MAAFQAMGISPERRDRLKRSEIGLAMIGAATLKKKGSKQVGSRVAQWSKTMHLSARCVTAVPGSNPGRPIGWRTIGPVSSGFGQGRTPLQIRICS